MDPVRTIQGLYQREGRVPSVRQLVKAGVRKAEIYKNYGGLRGLCKAAGVPLPEERFARVGAAMKSPRRVGVPRPITEEKPSGSIYKERSYAGPVQQLPPQQPYPSAPPPAQPPVVVKVDIGEVVAKELRGKEENETLPKEVSVEEGVREIFKKHREEERKLNESLRPIREGQEELGGRMDEVFAKLKRQEYPWQKPEAQAQPEASQPTQPQQPTEPVLTPYQLELQARQIGERIGTKIAQKMLGEKTKEAESEGGKAKEEKPKPPEEPQGEIPRPPEESQKEVPKEESPKHIFPTGEVGEK